jgi:hypothetical protein
MRNRIITLAATGLAAAALSLAGIAGASASTHPHKNATITCGGLCFNLSNLQLDKTGFQAFIQNAVGGKTGTSINMRGAGSAKFNEDFTLAINTVVGNSATALTACGQGFLAPTSIFCMNFGEFQNDPVIEANFSPGGVETGFCVGNQVANVAGRLALAPCGASPTTVWVFDRANFTVGRYAAFLNGADTNFSHPLALTVNPSSKSPRNVLRTDPENTLGGFLPDTQLFTFTFGIA